MRRRLPILVAALALAVAVAIPVVAITGGQPDGDGHPYVALLLGLLDDGAVLCSGTLIDEDVVLTAGHCTDYFGTDEALVLVTFDSEASLASDNWYTSTSWETHPGYVDADWPFTLDYGLVFLTEEVKGITPASLPEVGVLAEMIGTTGQTGWRFLDVGYGQDGVTVGGGPPTPNFDLVRKFSVQRYHPGKGGVGALDETSFVLQDAPPDKRGSACGGDSGSGIFPDAEDAFGDTVLAVRMGGYPRGNAGQSCSRVTSLNHRVDIAVVLDWIAENVD